MQRKLTLSKKLQLNRETLATLSSDRLAGVAGGVASATVTTVPPAPPATGNCATDVCAGPPPPGTGLTCFCGPSMACTIVASKTG